MIEVEGVQLEHGDALFTFNGLLEIVKTTSDPSAAGKTFAFEVGPADGSEDARIVNVTMGKEPDENGSYVGEAV